MHDGRYFDRDWVHGTVVDIEDTALAQRMLKLIDQVGSAVLHPFEAVEDVDEAPASDTSPEAEAGAKGDTENPDVEHQAGKAAESAGE
jgi:hypothetical protein